MIDKFIFVVSYSDRWPACLQTTQKNSVIDQFMALSVEDNDGGNANHWLDTFKEARSNDEPLICSGELQSVAIGKETTLIEEGYSPWGKTEVPTKQLEALIRAWADARTDFRACRSRGDDWHGIPTHKDNPTEDDAMYYDPQTGKTGLWKDVKKEWSPYNEKDWPTAKK